MDDATNRARLRVDRNRPRSMDWTDAASRVRRAAAELAAIRTAEAVDDLRRRIGRIEDLLAAGIAGGGL